MDNTAEALEKHYAWKGKIEMVCRVPLNSREDLALAYTPGVAAPCLAIQKDPSQSYQLTRRANLIAVVTDGSAVLGLGNIGGRAGMPVMEGKSALFKAFAGVDAIPLCVRSNNVDDIVNTVAFLQDSFGGINLEDIAAPRCFEIERRLQDICDIPVFHDDQHGTSIVVLAALFNALKLTNRRLEDIFIVVNGAGAAGIACVKLLLSVGLQHAILCDREGIIYEGRPGLSGDKAEIARLTNRRRLSGSLENALSGADAFIGVSAAGCLSAGMIRSMAAHPIIFAMANPVPEIMPDAALEAGAAIVGTGRSDFANQINNVLAFPGIFRGALDARARLINEEMKIAAARAIAALVSDDELSPNFILPNPLAPGVGAAVGRAVFCAAEASGVARL